MRKSIRITTLVENTVHKRDLLAEHGLAFWIEAGSQRILFDTGQGDVLTSNADALGIPLDAADKVVVSHGHYDHVGGLDRMLSLAPNSQVFAHLSAFHCKYELQDDGTCRDIGRPSSVVYRIHEASSDRFAWTVRPTDLGNGLHVTGQIPRRTTFEDAGGPFYLDRDCTDPDPLFDDQALYFESTEGIVVVLGCAHAGVINTLHYIRELTHGRAIHTVIGGMHLTDKQPDRIEPTVDALREFDISRIGLSHCTELLASVQLCAAFPGRCFPCCAGTVLEFYQS